MRLPSPLVTTWLEMRPSVVTTSALVSSGSRQTELSTAWRLERLRGRSEARHRDEM